MKIAVTVKLVPDTTADKRIDQASKRLVRTGVETVLNPFDEYAIEAALRVKEQFGGDSTVTIVTMAPESGREIVRKALAMGADDAILISDAGAEGSDVWGTARVLAAAIAGGGYDLVLCGTQSTDAGTGELPGALATYLDRPAITYARKFEIDGSVLRAERETDTGFTRVSADLPLVVSVTKSINEPRYPSLKGIMGAKKKTIATKSLADFPSLPAVGAAGARTEVTALELPAARTKGEVFTAADATAGAERILAFLAERKLV